jgi:FkbM family methyltransferase
LYRKHSLDVVWIEPIPEVFRRLTDHLRGFDKQLALQALVTDTNAQEYAFHISNNDGLSSSILELKNHKDIWPDVGYVTSLTLKSTTLATLFKTANIDARKYQALVMDTQGSELLVLRGCLPILNHFQFIKTEVPDFESYQGCCQLADIQAFMTEHGFQEISRSKFAGSPGMGNYYDVVYQRVQC